MRKHKPPSQIRYEKSHPTISFRLDRELKERLEEVLEGKSFADFVKEGLGVREREKKSLKEARDNGYSAGYNDACELFAVYTRCGICGERMVVRSSEMKRAIHEYIQNQGWGHHTCMVEREELVERKREKGEARKRRMRELKRVIEEEADRIYRKKRRR